MVAEKTAKKIFMGYFFSAPCMCRIMDECQTMIKLPCVTEHTSGSVVVITALFSHSLFSPLVISLRNIWKQKLMVFSVPVD